jgi:hypothetical protein
MGPGEFPEVPEPLPIFTARRMQRGAIARQRETAGGARNVASWFTSDMESVLDAGTRLVSASAAFVGYSVCTGSAEKVTGARLPAL